MAIYNNLEAAIADGARGDDLIAEACGRCGGRGNVGYGNVASSNVVVGRPVTGSCFDCAGRGIIHVQVASVKARVRRAAKLAAKLAAEKAEAEKAQEARRAWQAANPEAWALVDSLHGDEYGKGGSTLAYGLWNSRTAIPTAEELDELAAEAARRQAAKDAEVPVVTGDAVVITGEVLRTKWQESNFYPYRGALKMLVRDDRGFKVWGTCPSSLDVGAAERGAFTPDGKDRPGSRVTFTAAVEVSGDDQTFGFFKRARKATVL